MKKLLYLFSFILSTVFVQAQERPMYGQNRSTRPESPDMEMPQPPPPQRPMTKEQKERLEFFRIQFITKRLNLTISEAEKFWPAYNEQRNASQRLNQTKIVDEIEFQEAMLVIRKKFKKDLMPILKTEERVNQALKIDRELLNKMRTEMIRRKRSK